MKKNKSEIVIIFGFIFLPIILHLNAINIKQYEIANILQLVLFQLLISILIVIVSFFVKLITKKIEIYKFLICNFSTIFFLFYYKKINSLQIINSLQSINLYLDNIFTILIFLVYYVLIFIFLKKSYLFTKLFFLFFLFFNFILGVYSMNFLDNFTTNKAKTTISQDHINLDNLENLQSIKPTDVYLIVLDGMMSLDKAEKLEIIESKNFLLNQLKNSGYAYNHFYKSNYPVTYASIQSLLYGNFPITDETDIYTNRLDFYPYNMNDKKNFFYQIIHKLNVNFFWIGNKWGLCKGLKSKECFYNYSSSKNFLSELIFNTELFYIDSLFSYFFNYLNKDIIVTAFDFLRYKKFQKKTLLTENKSNFYFLHVYKPHKPYDLDDDCNNTTPRKILSNEKKYYKINYKCAFQTVLNWDKNFLDKKKNNIVIILGDHGWSLTKKNDDIDYIRSRVDDVFFAYKIPKKCNSIKVPNSHVNVMRFILNCLNDLDLQYLTDTQYIIRYEGHPDYGKAIKLVSK